MTKAFQHQAGCGPLEGLRVIEFAGIGPGPFAGQMLADMGADVIVIERAAEAARAAQYPRHANNRGKRSIAVDLKQAAGLETVSRLLASADALIEGFRPGVMERLGLGPQEVEQLNPRLVYGRVTGWGQDGPLAQAAGHDINYLALTGALSISARPGQPPTVPPTLLGDMAGGAMFLCFGMVCALLEARRSGRGQVVDAAMIDGVSAMSGLIHQMRHIGYWRDEAEHNFFLNSSPFYDAFECADGGHITLGAIEPAFYAELMTRLGIEVDVKRQYDTRAWPELRQRVAERIRQKTRQEWCELLSGTDVCFAPVLSLAQAPAHPHMAARAVFTSVEVDGRQQTQPSPAPRLSRTPGRTPSPGCRYGEHTLEILEELGLSGQEIQALRACGACA